MKWIYVFSVSLLKKTKSGEPISAEDATKIVEEISKVTNAFCISFLLHLNWFQSDGGYINLDDFRAWYENSNFFSKRKHQLEEEQELAEGYNIAWIYDCYHNW